MCADSGELACREPLPAAQSNLGRGVRSVSKTPRIVFRADAGAKVGLGHLTRCLTLAEALSALGAHVVFVVRDYPDALCDRITAKGFPVMMITSSDSAPSASRPGKSAPSGAQQLADARETSALIADAEPDALIVDHYGLGVEWERTVQLTAQRVFVIDDLVRAHHCDLLIDQTSGRATGDYNGRVPSGTRLLLGTGYALLGREYHALHDTAPQADVVRRVHVYFGSGNPEAALPRFVSLILAAADHVQVLAVGLGAPSAMHLLAEQFGKRLEWHEHTREMPRLMASCDLAVGSPGVATWERACLGVPAALMATDDTQVSILEGLDRIGFARYLGDARAITDAVFVQRFGSLLANGALRRSLRQVGTAAVDGLGASRVATFVMAGCKS